MNRIWTIVGIIVLIGIIGGATWYLLREPAAQTPNTNTPDVSFPTASGVNGGSTTTSGGIPTFSVPARQGNGVSVRDFRGDAGVTANAYDNQGYYLLSGNPEPAAGQDDPYEIHYSAFDGSFGIQLNTEPLGRMRLEAEQKLMGMLGISPADMCRLNYVVAVQADLNETYRGVNLGFSFCPGAVKLPQ